MGEALEEDAEGGLQFEPGEGGADAEVDAGAEADVGIGTAGGGENFGGGKLLLVVVGGGEQESHLVALFQREAAVFEVFEGVAFEHVEGGVETEHFFGAGCGVGEEVGGTPVAEKGLDTVAEGVDGGFVAGIEKKDGSGDEFVVGEGGVIIITSRDEQGEKIPGGMSAAFLEEVAHVSAERDGCSYGAILNGAVATGLIHGDHVVRPCEDLRPHVVGDAEKSGDDHDGDRFGEGRDQVGGSLCGELVDQFVRQTLHFRTESLDLTREERRIDEPAQAGVHWGFDFEQGVFFEFVERREMRGCFGPSEFLAGGKMEDLASEAAVAEEGADVLVAGEAPVA